MNKRLIVLLAVAISICTLALISVQVQWIQSMIKAEKTYFSRHVELVLDQVVNAVRVHEWQGKAEREFQFAKPSVDTLLPVTQRISQTQIDALLRQELNNAAISISYDFAVTDESGAIVFATDNFAAAEPEHSYSAALFPNDPEGATHYYLNVYLPHYHAYIIHSVVWMIIVSVLLTLVITATFAATLIIIFRQKRLTKIKTDFVNNITHELRTPVTTISLAAQMLQDPAMPDLQSAVPRLSGIIRNESKRLLDMVENILQSAVFKRGLKLSIKELDVHTMIDNVLSQFSLQFDTLHVTVERRLEAVDTHISGDEIHLANALSNLIENAIKYRKEMEPLHILITTRNEKNRIIVSVTDNGIGIDHAAPKQLFAQFYRAPSENMHTVKGFGLGLYYVKNIIETHHGKLFATGSAGKGSTFGFEIPVARSAGKSLRPALASPASNKSVLKSTNL